MAKEKKKKSIKSRFKIFTALASIFGSLSLLSLITTLVLAEAQVITLFSNDVRSYKVEFYDNGVYLDSQTLIRGAKINTPELGPVELREKDGSISVFLGWDYTGEGIPDKMPTNAYFNFRANSVYFNIPGEDIPYDLLLELLENGLLGDLDLSSFMPDGGLDPSMLENLFKLSPTVFTFKSDFTSSYDACMHFRVASFGDYNASKGQWKNAPTYKASNISENSINPMEYAADKCKNAFALMGYKNAVATTTIKCKDKAAKYPVVSYEIGNEQHLDSDSYSLTNAGTKEYTCQSSSAYTTAETLDLARMTPFSNNAITSDEKVYREYARENYINVDSKYDDVLSRVITDGHFANFSFNNPDTNEIIAIKDYMVSNYEYTYSKPKTPSGQDSFKYFIKDAKQGTGFEFATATTLIYRKLGLPARTVEGYYGINTTPGETVEVKSIQATYWTEVYVSGLGWITIDPAIEAIALATGMVPDGLLGGAKGNGSDLDNTSGDINNNFSKNGDGKNPNTSAPMFTFTTKKAGPMYFKMDTYDVIEDGMASHSSYLSNSTYASTLFNTYGLTTSPTLYTAYAASGIFDTATYKITAKTNFTHGPRPIYSTSDDRGIEVTDRYQSGAMSRNEETSAASTTMFEPTKVNLGKLKNNLRNKHPAIYNENLLYGSLVASSLYLGINEPYLEYFTEFAESKGLSASDPEIYTKVRDAVKYHAKYDYEYKFPDSQDPILYFMQTAKKGICQHFAGATVLLFRALGIPARYTVGYYGYAKSVRDENTVTGQEAHAWTEVWVNGVGWVDLDSTGLVDNEDTGTTDQSLGWIQTSVSSSSYQSNITVTDNRIQFTKTYDGKGTELELAEALTDSAALLDGHKIVVNTTSVDDQMEGGSGGFIGRCSISILDEDDENVTSWYSGMRLKKGNASSTTTNGEETYVDFPINSDKTAIEFLVSVMVNRRPITIKTLSQDFAYDDKNPGQVKKYEQYSPPALVSGDEIVALDFTGEISEIGSVPNSVDESSLRIENSKGEDVTDCYEVTYELGTLTMTPMEIQEED